MAIQLLKKQKKQLSREDMAEIIEQDISELLCPLFELGFCKALGDRAHCYNPREYENCVFYTKRWDGL